MLQQQEAGVFLGMGKVSGAEAAARLVQRNSLGIVITKQHARGLLQTGVGIPVQLPVARLAAHQQFTIVIPKMTVRMQGENGAAVQVEGAAGAQLEPAQAVQRSSCGTALIKQPVRGH